MGGSYNTPRAIFYLLKGDYRTCASYRLHEQEAELSCLRATLGLGFRVFNAVYRHCDYHFCSCGLLYLGSPVNLKKEGYPFSEYSALIRRPPNNKGKKGTTEVPSVQCGLSPYDYHFCSCGLLSKRGSSPHMSHILGLYEP